MRKEINRLAHHPVRQLRTSSTCPVFSGRETYKVLVLTLIQIFALVSFAMHAKASEKLEMDVSIREPSPKDYQLHIKIQNTGTKLISLNDLNIPWEHPEYFLVLAVTADFLQCILQEKQRPIDDHDAGTFRIQPGGTLEGQVSLNGRFPEMPKLIEETEILIFWNHQFKPIDGKPLQRKGGWLIIPKTSTVNSPAGR